jgi:ABC-type uncharacterized transport system substrate-binding protein
LRRPALIALAFGCAVWADAQEPTAVLSSDSGHYRQALEGFSEAWGSSVPVIMAGAPLPVEANAFVAIGGKAAARRWPRNSIVVACLAPAIVGDTADAVTRVSLMPDPEALAERLSSLVPRLKVLRAFWSSESSRGDMDALVKAGEKLGVVVLSEQISPASRLPERLRGLDDEADALWLMPDPELVNAENFAIMREYAAARKIPFLGPTEGLAERGATATIAATFREMGRAAALSLRARLAGRAEAEVIYVRRATVTVNAGAARAAGVSLAIDSADKVLP